MKLGALALSVLILFTGCSSGNRELERGLSLRSAILSAEECTFDARITADYGDRLHIFSVSCAGDRDGTLKFTVTEPESISGITGELSEEGGKLTFDGAALQFDTMAEGLVSPVSAPWIFFNTLRGGYLTAAGKEEDLLRLTIHDSYEEDALQLDIWLDEENAPVRAEILHENRRILTLDVGNFVIR